MKRNTHEMAAFLRAQAETMRQNPTKSEQALWEELKPLGFEFQSPLMGETKNGGVWKYILDFYHPKAMLCVEIDGGYHYERGGPDRRRDMRLGNMGIRTQRFLAKDVEDPIKRLTIVSIVKGALAQQIKMNTAPKH